MLVLAVDSGAMRSEPTGGYVEVVQVALDVRTERWANVASGIFARPKKAPCNVRGFAIVKLFVWQTPQAICPSLSALSRTVWCLQLGWAMVGVNMSAQWLIAPRRL